MQFNNYINLRNTMARNAMNPDAREWAKAFNPDEFRRHAVETMLEDARQTDADKLGGDDSPLSHLTAALAEQHWVGADRPFYNIWPVVAEMAPSVKLDLPIATVEVPFECLVLRFAKGYESGLKTAMIYWPKEPSKSSCHYVWVFGYPVDNPDGRIAVRFHYTEPNTPVENWLENLRRQDRPQYNNASELLIRLTVLVGLLANDRDVITSIVLSKDQEKYASTDDDEVRKTIERRAVRRLGHGFDVGKALQKEKEQSPHWRNPHLALFWTGKERLKPIIKMRSGAIIHRVSMAEVPTGYLGPETDKDAELEPERFERVAISTSKRFEIFKRDGYRCHLCGVKADDGAALHVDHRLAVAKGGLNDDDNLWTLCDRCNLGKSDADL